MPGTRDDVALGNTVDIDAAFLDDDMYQCGELDISTELFRKARARLAHAENRLKQGSTAEDFGDVIIALHGAVKNREDGIVESFCLRQIPRFKGWPSFKILESLGVVRPIMSTELADLRNAFEHRGEKAPAREQCERNAEFVWYFIRATDYVTTSAGSQVTFRDPSVSGSPASVDVFVKHSTWEFRLAGRFPSSEVHAVPQPRGLKVRVTRLHSKSSGDGADTLDAIGVEGEIFGPESVLNRLIAIFAPR